MKNIVQIMFLFIMASQTIQAQALELPLSIEGNWVGYPSDSSFRSELEYKLSPMGRYLYASNQLFNKEGKEFRTYEGMYFIEGDQLKYHIKGPGTESHSGYAILDADTLTHYATIFPGTSIKSYQSIIIKVDENQFHYFANYSADEEPPKEVELKNQIIYRRKSSILLAQESKLEAFNTLVGSTWVSEGKQLGGHDGKTVKEISWGLEGKIVKVKTWTTDPQTLEFGLRNEGVRTFNAEAKQVEFYEFDKLGGVSKGVVRFEGKNIYYEYAYGDLLLRDSWTFISEDEYQYLVCSIKNDTCDQVYHQGTFKRQ